MSGRGHSSNAAEIAYTLSVINKSSDDQIRDLYGIEIKEDGSVIDLTYSHIKFNTVTEWIQFNIEQDDIEFEEHFSTGKYYSED